MTDAERQAQREDARRRLAELRAVARALWPDREDAEVMSELTAVVGQIRAAEAVLKGVGDACS